jgi:hypothetical protein
MTQQTVINESMSKQLELTKYNVIDLLHRTCTTLSSVYSGCPNLSYLPSQGTQIVKTDLYGEMNKSM